MGDKTIFEKCVDKLDDIYVELGPTSRSGDFTHLRQAMIKISEAAAYLSQVKKKG